MCQRIISVISNRYVLAAILTLVLIGALPNYFSKYHLELVDTEFIQGSRIYYEDLNGDGLSEKIQYYHNSIDKACYMIFTSNNDLVDQFNFMGVIPTMSFKTLWFLDLNNNGSNEIYNLTQRMDSVFLNIQEPFVENGLNRKDIFIDTVSPYDNNYKVVESSKAFKINSKGESAIVFGLNAGFAANPRHIYSYSPYSGKVLKSHHLVNVSVPAIIHDVDANGSQEIILRNHASDNDIDSLFTKRSDRSSWLSVLRSDLDFLFEPIEFNIKAGIQANPLNLQGDKKLLVYLNSKRKGLHADTFFLFDVMGNKEREIEVEPIEKGYLFIDYGNEQIILNDRQKGWIYTYDYNLNKIDTKILKNKGHLCQIKLKHSLEPLWLQYDLKQNQLILYQPNFKHPTALDVPLEVNKLFLGTKDYASISQLQVWQNDKSYLLEYSENPLYVLQFAIYLLLYAVILSLIWLIQKGQRIRIEKQRAIETEIAELQLKTIKNQVDPHFVFNAINTISEMTLMDNKLEADALISRFSGFMRDTLKHSDKISTSLGEELDYTENFIKLQQLRFMNSFDYTIELGKSIDLAFLVPKHVLFTFVENAIKHGLSSVKKGKLTIQIAESKTDLIIIVENRGKALTLCQEIKGTGNGLKIMNRIFDLYTKRFGRVITSRTEEVTDNGEIGQQVIININKTVKT